MSTGWSERRKKKKELAREKVTKSVSLEGLSQVRYREYLSCMVNPSHSLSPVSAIRFFLLFV